MAEPGANIRNHLVLVDIEDEQGTFVYGPYTETAAVRVVALIEKWGEGAYRPEVNVRTRGIHQWSKKDVDDWHG